MANALLQEELALVDPPTTSGDRKVRVQLDFEPADMRVINDLVAQLRLGTRAELFRSGLRALRWMVQKKQQECSIFAFTQDGRYLEPEFDFLERLSVPAVPEEVPRPLAVERHRSDCVTETTHA